MPDDTYEPTWFPPRHGDVAIIERRVPPGHDPYPIVVCWHHGEGWWNVAGLPGPMPGQPEPQEFRELVIRDGAVARREGSTDA